MAALDAERDVARFQVPLLLTVGEADTITPAKFARRLLAASCSPQKELHVFPGVEHAGAPDTPEYVIVLAAFLSRALAALPAPAPPAVVRLTPDVAATVLVRPANNPRSAHLRESWAPVALTPTTPRRTCQSEYVVAVARPEGRAVRVGLPGLDEAA